MSINPDAHSIAELDLLKCGVAIARKGGVGTGRVLNAMRLEELRAFFQRRRAVGKQPRARTAIARSRR